MSETRNDENWVEAIGKPAFESIEEMVRALEFETWLEDHLAGLTPDQLRARLIEIRDLDADEDTGEIAEIEAMDADDLRELLVDELSESDTDFDEDGARQRIEEDPLSLQVRSDWCSPGEEMTPGEYELLLGTGGPAVRIVGDLDDNQQPSSARLQVQDWFKPWTEYHCDHDTLLHYASVFYFGD